ncbi:MAG: hypothetical protein IJZ75_03350 [Clostridia bacterium]|nr:hypothetical protein [Clostridia bacterium]
MVKGILISCVFLLAVAGICEVIHLIRLYFVSDGKKMPTYSLVFLRQGRAINQLRYEYEQRLWQGGTYAETVIAVDKELDEDERKLCYEFARKKDIIIAPAEMLGRILDTLYSNEEKKVDSE